MFGVGIVVVGGVSAISVVGGAMVEVEIVIVVGAVHVEAFDMCACAFAAYVCVCDVAAGVGDGILVMVFGGYVVGDGGRFRCRVGLS